MASLITAPELMVRAANLTGEYHRPMQVSVTAGVTYVLMAFPLSVVARRLERAMAPSRLRTIRSKAC